MATNKNQIKETAKEMVMGELAEIIETLDGQKIGAFEFGVPIKVEDTEVVVTLKLTTKNWYDTKQAPAFNLDDAVEEYLSDCEYKKKIKAEKERAKAEKIAKSKK